MSRPPSCPPGEWLTYRAAVMAIIVMATLFVAIALLSWPTGDDFCLPGQVGHDNPIAFALRKYQVWSGRLLTMAVIGVVYRWLDPVQLDILVALCAASLALCAYQMATLVTERGSTERIVTWALLMPALWIGLHGIAHEVVFWATGAIVYLIPTLVGLAWCQALLRSIEHGTARHPGTWTSRALGVPWLLLGILTGNGIEQLTMTLALFGCIVTAWHWRALSRHARGMVAALLGGLTLGGAALYAAPGNFARAGGSAGPLGQAPLQLLHNLATVTSNYVLWSTNAVLVALGLGLLLLAVRPAPVGGNAPAAATSVSGTRSLGVAVALSGAAIGGLLPMAFVPTFAVPRTALYFMLFVIMAAVAWARALSPYVEHRRGTPRPWTWAVVIAVLTLATGVDAGRDLGLAVRLQPVMQARDAYLRSRAGTPGAVAVPPLGGNVPRSLHYRELSDDPGSWLNTCQARYYGVETIELDRARHDRRPQPL